MARLAVDGVPGLVVDDLEVRRGGTSYMVDTLRELRARGLDRPVLLLGYDAAAELGSWHQAAEIPVLAHVVVFNRAGAAPQREPGALPPGTTVVEVDSPQISATAARQRLAAGEDVSGLIPASVLEYIRDRGLYGAGK